MKRFSWVLGLLLIVIVVLLTAQKNMPKETLTDLDAVTAAGTALEENVPESYLFDDYIIGQRQVRINGQVQDAIEVKMIYSHPETRERLQYVVYLDPESAELLGYGTKSVLAPAAP